MRSIAPSPRSSGSADRGRPSSRGFAAGFLVSLTFVLTALPLDHARADSALLPGFRAGLLLERESNRPLAAQFAIGAGLDWLHTSGLTLGARLDTGHEIDAALSLDAGWSGRGLLEGEGCPLAALLGPAIGFDLEGERRAGGRARLVVGLWYSRATIELDVAVWREIGLPAASSAPLDVRSGVYLRIAPWEPLLL